MNLLTDTWIPVRPLAGGTPGRIGLCDVLCGDEKWEVSLPRDDLELAAIQLLIAMVQVLFMPKDGKELKERISRPLPGTVYQQVVPRFDEWFRLDHPTYPFMQVRGVDADKVTPMDKLLAGVTGATNCCFLNQPGLAHRVCGSCAAIALFNQASCSPSFGGGFKNGLRGASPITTLVQGDHLRRTVWLNVLSEDFVERALAWHPQTKDQFPTWIDPIRSGNGQAAEQIGLARGLLWQPAHVELLPPAPAQSCSCCGMSVASAYTAFRKAKFSFTIAGTWPHPHSPRYMRNKNGALQEKFAAFTTSAPAWTQLNRFVVQQETDGVKTEGHQPAAVVLQSRELLGSNSARLHLLVGGYRNSQSSVLERRHEVFTLNHGWDRHTLVIRHFVELGLGYRNALMAAVSLFVNGIKESGKRAKVKGAGVKLVPAVEADFYRRSGPLVEDVLARLDFAEPAPHLRRLTVGLQELVFTLLEESVSGYLNDPELVRTAAVARKTLWKKVRNLEPQDGGKDETPETP